MKYTPIDVLKSFRDIQVLRTDTSTSPLAALSYRIPQGRVVSPEGIAQVRELLKPYEVHLKQSPPRFYDQTGSCAVLKDTPEEVRIQMERIIRSNIKSSKGMKT